MARRWPSACQVQALPPSHGCFAQLGVVAGAAAVVAAHRVEEGGVSGDVEHDGAGDAVVVLCPAGMPSAASSRARLGNSSAGREFSED